MRRRNRFAWIGTGLIGLLLLSQPAHAVEYRLLVASVFDTSLTSFIAANELTYGASGQGLQRLEMAISTGGIGWGDMPVGRPLTGVPDSIARAWSGVGIRADILRGGVDAGRWDEVRWEGKPGERSIWLIKATGNNRPQSVQHVTLESGVRPARLYPPYVFTGGSGRRATGRSAHQLPGRHFVGRSGHRPRRAEQQDAAVFPSLSGRGAFDTAGGP